MRVNSEFAMEVENVKEELEIKEQKIEHLELELVKARNFELILLEKDKRIQELETEAHIRNKQLEMLNEELKRAIEAEEKTTKALEDLALALKEVCTEANQAKEISNFTRIELDHVKDEARQLKEMLRTNEERYERMLEEARQELELHMNTSERLRLEAEETVLAWNGKEMGFVSCIKRAEEERAVVESENNKLVFSLKEAESISVADKEEMVKLRGVLKQAISEANAAKAAAGIAKDENCRLKDSISEMEEALKFLMRENERVKINEDEVKIEDVGCEKNDVLEKVEDEEREISTENETHV